MSKSRKSMVEFRAALRKVKTSVLPNGIYAADINVMIDQMADLGPQEEARDYFNVGQYTERVYPWVNIIGLMACRISEQIDVFGVTYIIRSNNRTYHHNRRGYCFLHGFNQDLS